MTWLRNETSKILCALYVTTMVDTRHYMFAQTHRMTPRASPTGHDGLCVMMTRQCRFIGCDRWRSCWDADKRGGCARVGAWGTWEIPTFCSMLLWPKTDLKIKALKNTTLWPPVRIMQIFLLFQDPPEVVVRINELTYAENTKIPRAKSVPHEGKKIQDMNSSTATEQ